MRIDQLSLIPFAKAEAGDAEGRFHGAADDPVRTIRWRAVDAHRILARG
jgi:hypothetical protein